MTIASAPVAYLEKLTQASRVDMYDDKAIDELERRWRALTREDQRVIRQNIDLSGRNARALHCTVEILTDTYA